jgi:FG-GAP-like repeat
MSTSRTALASLFGIASIVGASALAHAQSHHGAGVLGDVDGDRRGDVVLTGGMIPSGSPWYTVPVAHSNGDGTFRVTNENVPNFPSQATEPDAVPVAGDFDGDGNTDVALIGRRSDIIPVAFSYGGPLGDFYVTEYANRVFADFAAHWPSQPHAATPVAGDFDGDGRTDIALVGGFLGGGPSSPLYPWGSIPIAFSNGWGTFRVTNYAVADFPLWATQPNAQPVAADFDGNGCTDLALTGGFSPPSFGADGGPPWVTIPVAYSECNGHFHVSNVPVADFPLYATQDALAVAGDFNGDGLGDIALTGGRSPGGAPWTTIPVAFSTGAGFRVTNYFAADFPLYATQIGAQVIATDLDGDGRDDLALAGGHIPTEAWGGAPWSTIPVAFSNGDGTFRVTNSFVPDFPTFATQGYTPPRPAAPHLPPTAVSASQARRHQIFAVLENVDDIGDIWWGNEDTGRLILDVNSGDLPRKGFVALSPLALDRMYPLHLTVKFSNAGCFNSSGTVRFVVDGLEVLSDGEGPAWRICDWFYRKEFNVNTRYGTVNFY